jgi:DNA-binding MarR family transcriptional regulator
LSYLDLAVGIAVGGAAGLAVRILWERYRRPRGSLSTRPPPPRPTPAVEPTPQVAPGPEPAPVSPSRASPVRTADGSAIRADAVSLRISQRIVLHVYAQGRIARDDVAPSGLCQAGMSEALDEPQTHLAKPLARLVAGGVLLVDRRHVSGKSRRLLVYTLTPLGEALARDLRRSLAPGSVPNLPAWVGRP